MSFAGGAGLLSTARDYGRFDAAIAELAVEDARVGRSPPILRPTGRGCNDPPRRPDKFFHPEHAAGVWQNFYGVPGLIFHAISTLASYRQYLAPFDNLLFFAAWPMLAACFTLYLLRDLDTRWRSTGRSSAS
jgi:hypothetical protein